MWKSMKSTPQSVIIVESEDGNVFIVEDVKSKTQVEKILMKTEKSPKASTRRSRQKIESRDPSPVDIMQDFKNEEEVIIEEYLEEYLEDEECDAMPMSFVDPNVIREVEEIPVYSSRWRVKSEEKLEVEIVDNYAMPEAQPELLDHTYTDQCTVAEVAEATFDGNYSSDEFAERSDDETLADTKVKVQKSSAGKPQRHKLRQLTGKPACKYCDTIFKTKESLKMHVCEYLQCDPKNFICRICKKELSRKTFSNHLHETLDCQYCHKKFVNPRNMKAHIRNVHKDEKFIPPNSPDREMFEQFENLDESMEPVLDEATGMLVTMKAPRKKYPRKKGRFECDLCGRIFTTVRSLKIHMDLHTNNHRYICTICGEKYTTHTGISKHACLNKKRKRPAVDFRIFDVRHCKYCGLSFENLEDTKAHSCEYQFEHVPKMFRCRFCLVDMSKNSYNKHMNRHLVANKEWICGFCDKKLSDEVGLNIHMTTHTGDKPFKCPFENCEQSFISKQLLTRHSRFHGVEIPIYNCKICNKEVASKYHLKSHMKIHNEKVECGLCRAEFESREALKQHYQDEHTPYPCPYCDKSFTLPRYLKMHEKIHNPIEKNYRCDLCQSMKSFTKPALLMNHVFKNHNEMFEDWKARTELFK